MPIRSAKLASMTNGWFIGAFTPTLFSTESVEVAVKEYKAGFADPKHFHKIATEFTVIVRGDVEVNGQAFSTGDIIIIPPGEIAEFRAITSVITAVVKIPGAVNDKFTVEGCGVSP